MKDYVQMYVYMDENLNVYVKAGVLNRGIIKNLIPVVYEEYVKTDKDLLLQVLKAKDIKKQASLINSFKILEKRNILAHLENKNVLSITVLKNSVVLNSLNVFGTNKNLQVEIKGNSFVENLSYAFEIVANRIAHNNLEKEI